MPHSRRRILSSAKHLLGGTNGGGTNGLANWTTYLLQNDFDRFTNEVAGYQQLMS